VGEEDEIGFPGGDYLGERKAIGIGRVGFQQIVFDGEDFGYVFGG
jgi:hypothetical protein